MACLAFPFFLPVFPPGPASYRVGGNFGNPNVLFLPVFGKFGNFDKRIFSFKGARAMSATPGQKGKRPNPPVRLAQRLRQIAAQAMTVMRYEYVVLSAIALVC
jgi:hypothetical protein